MGLFDFFKSSKNASPPSDSIFDLVEVSSGLRVPRFFATRWHEFEKTKLSFAVHAKAQPVISPLKILSEIIPAFPDPFKCSCLIVI